MIITEYHNFVPTFLNYFLLVYNGLMKGIGTQIRELRKKAGWTLKELAKRAEVSYSTLAKIEIYPERRPRIDTLRKIASALDVSLVELDGYVELEPTEMGIEDLKMVLSRVPELTESDIEFFYNSIENLIRRRHTQEGKKELEMLRRLEEEAKRSLTREDFEAAAEAQVLADDYVDGREESE